MKAMVWRFSIALILVVVSIVGLSSASQARAEEGRLITLYDRGVKTVFLAKEKTLGEALKVQHITLDARDIVEPAASEELIAPAYHVNIYRARPVVVVDGAIRLKTVSSHQTVQQIAKDVGITVYDEDITTLKPSSDFIYDGAGLLLTINRAKTFILDLYGKKTEARTHVATVGAMLREKQITLGPNGRVSVPENTPITQGMEVRVWREGKQTVTLDQEIPFASQLVYDGDRPLGYRAVQSKGVPGVRSVTYELEVKGGVEVSKIAVANIVTRNAVKQVEVIGLRNDGSGLTLSRGALFHVDSKGVTHRETYYDLNMRVVMQSCGQGGYYSVRPDGAKVDAQGYIIIAANFARYPRCSFVETSIGTGKVYDTGGFVARYPDGFDLATDWSRADGI